MHYIRNLAFLVSGNIQLLARAKTIKPDTVNAANVYISVKDAPDIREAFKQGLIFENALVQYRHSRVMQEASVYEKIISPRKTRMDGKEAELH